MISFQVDFGDNGGHWPMWIRVRKTSEVKNQNLILHKIYPSILTLEVKDVAVLGTTRQVENKSNSGAKVSWY